MTWCRLTAHPAGFVEARLWHRTEAFRSAVAKLSADQQEKLNVRVSLASQLKPVRALARGRPNHTSGDVFTADELGAELGAQLIRARVRLSSRIGLGDVSSRARTLAPENYRYVVGAIPANGEVENGLVPTSLRCLERLLAQVHLEGLVWRHSAVCLARHTPVRVPRHGTSRAQRPMLPRMPRRQAPVFDVAPGASARCGP